MLTVTRDVVLPSSTAESDPMPRWYAENRDGCPFKAAMDGTRCRERYPRDGANTSARPQTRFSQAQVVSRARGYHRSRIPAASRSHVVVVTPVSRSGNF